MPYDFGYDVQDDYSGNNYGHEEQSDGNVVSGEYFVQLPDGRLQIVTYTADHYNGYQANVRYEGEAQYPHPSEYKHQSYGPPQPKYEKPKPTYKPRPTYKPKPTPKPTYMPYYEEPEPQYY